MGHHKSNNYMTAFKDLRILINKKLPSRYHENIPDLLEQSLGILRSWVRESVHYIIERARGFQQHAASAAGA